MFFRYTLGVLGVVWLGMVPALAHAQDPGVVSEFERSADTSPEEKRQYAADALVELEAIVRSLSRMLDQVKRSDGNPDDEQCVRNAFTTAQSLLRVSENGADQLELALVGGEDELAEHQFRKIAIALTKARQILAEGERCAFGDDVRSGQTSVKWEGGVTEGADEAQDVVLSDLDLASDPPNVSPF